MSSATIAVTKQNIRARQGAIKKIRAELRGTPLGVPRRKHLEEKFLELLTELNALEASLFFYKTPRELGLLLTKQKKKVAALAKKVQSAKGGRKVSLAKTLQAESKVLRQMMAAAQLQVSGQEVTNPIPAPLPDIALVPESEAASGDLGLIDAGAETAADSIQEKVEAAVEDASLRARAGKEQVEEAVAPVFQVIQGGAGEVQSSVSEMLSSLDESLGTGDDEGEPFYKHPIFFVGVGLVVGGLIFRR